LKKINSDSVVDQMIVSLDVCFASNIRGKSRFRSAGAGASTKNISEKYALKLY
jgi:hypothetical protein